MPDSGVTKSEAEFLILFELLDLYRINQESLLLSLDFGFLELAL